MAPGPRVTPIRRSKPAPLASRGTIVPTSSRREPWPCPSKRRLSTAQTGPPRQQQIIPGPFAPSLRYREALPGMRFPSGPHLRHLQVGLPDARRHHPLAGRNCSLPALARWRGSRVPLTGPRSPTRTTRRASRSRRTRSVSASGMPRSTASEPSGSRPAVANGREELGLAPAHRGLVAMTAEPHRDCAGRTGDDHRAGGRGGGILTATAAGPSIAATAGDRPTRRSAARRGRAAASSAILSVPKQASADAGAKRHRQGGVAGRRQVEADIVVDQDGPRLRTFRPPGKAPGAPPRPGRGGGAAAATAPGPRPASASTARPRPDRRSAVTGRSPALRDRRTAGSGTSFSTARASPGDGLLERRAIASDTLWSSCMRGTLTVPRIASTALPGQRLDRLEGEPGERGAKPRPARSGRRRVVLGAGKQRVHRHDLAEAPRPGAGREGAGRARAARRRDLRSPGERGQVHGRKKDEPLVAGLPRRGRDLLRQRRRRPRPPPRRSARRHGARGDGGRRDRRRSVRAARSRHRARPARCSARRARCAARRRALASEARSASGARRDGSGVAKISVKRRWWRRISWRTRSAVAAAAGSARRSGPAPQARGRGRSRRNGRRGGERRQASRCRRNARCRRSPPAP